MNDQLLKKCESLLQSVKELTARNEQLEKRLGELREQIGTGS